MNNWYVWILSVGHLVIDLGQGTLPIFMPLLADKLSLSYFQIGTLTLAFNFTSALIQPAFGLFSDRISMPWIMPLGLLLSGLGMALAGMVNSYALLLFAVLLSGIGMAGYHPEGSKLAHYVSAEGKAGATMAIFSVGGNLGLGLGPMVAMFILSFSGLDSMPGIIIPGLLTSLVFLFLLPRFKKILAENTPKRKKKTEKNSCGNNNITSLVLLLLYVSVRSWINNGLIYFIPFYFTEFKGVAEPGFVVSNYLIAGAIGTLVGGFFADRVGCRSGLVASMAVALLTVYPLIHLNGSWVTVFAFISGIALISTFSTSVVFGQILLPNNIGLASGLLLGFGVGMGSIGVTLLGALADYAGLPLVMNILSLLPLLGIVLAFTLPDARVQKAETCDQTQ